jgi:hypothetical protein
MVNWNWQGLALVAVQGLAVFMLVGVGLLWWGFSSDVAFWMGWWASLTWVAIVAWVGGMRWRAQEYERQVAKLRREFEEAQSLMRLEVHLRRPNYSAQVRYLVPTTQDGAPLMNGADVTRELARAAALLTQGRNWSYRETQLTETLYTALRDRLVDAGFLYPVEARQPVRWTVDSDGGGLGLLESAAKAMNMPVTAREVAEMRELSVAACRAGV